eukprot:CAMPEP_0197844896 /NCGR_PEP_ID=MMETSP1438-20131217/1874_1 /TAXON_ID=1461541 /ORGANISM="Pterosperma sp., Strain CCMP1384" /LENGTH=122 /DNA_ID=CAMNT_0043455925 /DNA_START=62 /DNA_END=430 /DNA_ORIENTATION=-
MRWFEAQPGWTEKYPLQHAAMKGDIQRIQDLIEKENVDPNGIMKAWHDSTPLGWAAAFGQLSAVIKLIQLGADPLKPPNKVGNTPLRSAKRERHSAVVDFLEKYETRLTGFSSSSGGCCSIV